MFKNAIHHAVLIMIVICDPKIHTLKVWAIQDRSHFPENFVMSLLLNRQDVVAADDRAIGHYLHDLTNELMVFAIRN